MKVGDEVWVKGTIAYVNDQTDKLLLAKDWVHKENVIQFAGEPFDTVNLLAEIEDMMGTEGHVSGDYTDGFLFALESLKEWITKRGGR